MQHYFTAAFAAMALLWLAILPVNAAPLTYNVDFDLQGQGTLEGTITTDGTVNAYLIGSDYVAWDLMLTVNGATRSFTEANSIMHHISSYNGLYATEDALTFNFEQARYFRIYRSLEIASGVSVTDFSICFQRYTNCSLGISGSVAAQIGYSSAELERLNLDFNGEHVVATVVPVPAALPLLMSALGFFGFVGWRRKRMAEA